MGYRTLTTGDHLKWMILFDVLWVWCFPHFR